MKITIDQIVDGSGIAPEVRTYLLYAAMRSTSADPEFSVVLPGIH